MVRINAILFLLILAATACSKEKSNRNKVAGVWEIEKLEQDFYSGNQVDSSKTEENAGKFILINEGSSDFNGFYYDFSKETNKYAFLPLMQAQSLGTMKDECNWNMDDVSDERLTLFVGTITSNWYTHISFSRIQKAQGLKVREKWQYLELNTDGSLRIKEVYTLKRIKS